MKQSDYEKIRKERRFKILWISKEEILNCVIPNDSKLNEIKRIILPAHYHIINIEYDIRRDAWAFLIGSEEFPEIALGAEIDCFDNDFKYTLIKIIKDKDFKVIK